MDLPMDNEPLVLADGTEIDPTNGRVVKHDAPTFISVPSPSEAQKIIAKTRRSVADLPLPPEQLSGVALVAFYTLFGLGVQDISIAVNGKLSVEQIENIQQLDAYRDFMDSAKQNILHTAQNAVRELFERNAVTAAEKVIRLAQSDSEVLAFKASQDVLDRAGHRPTDIVEHRHKMEDALNIVVTRKDDRQEVPMIDITPEHING